MHGTKSWRRCGPGAKARTWLVDVPDRRGPIMIVYFHAVPGWVFMRQLCGVLSRYVALCTQLHNPLLGTGNQAASVFSRT